ncbi:epimerase/racemase [Lithospermum erythrorhizon]|uniref:Aldose 1-epimerase n=1 Tax=Lithospermum erythrorhizon TaxID=34254 RepID=A0AAV3RWT4_LITER
MSKFYLQLFCVIFVAGAFLVNGDGEEIGVYEIKKGDFSIKLSNFGARVMSMFLPDKNGNLADVVLGYDTINEYLNETKRFGPIVGRVANRIGGAQFTLNGITYKLDVNEGNSTTIHGGSKGFSQRVWSVKKVVKDGPIPSITFTYRSADGEEGFPGAVIATVTYAITAPYKLTITMKAKSLNKATPISLAHHSYINLGGHNSGDILSDEVQIFASKYTPVDSKKVPTGEIVTVKGTAYDFRKPQTVKSGISKLPKGLKGFDMNYDMNNANQKYMKKVAVVRNEKSGRVLKVWSNAPGMQFYTGDSINVTGKGGYQYKNFAAMALEPLGFPDSVNHPNFPSQIVYPGKLYKHVMHFEFST